MKYDKRKIWQVGATAEQMRSSPLIAELTERLKITPVTAQLLVNRGCGDVAAAEEFLSKNSGLLHDPMLLRDMDKAVARILEAVKKREKTVIFGDYDVDGVTSVCILHMYLKKHGVDISYYIPCRSGEGYGMSEAAIKRFRDDGITLIITVDTGVTAIEEAAYAKSLGVDIIITDHHECRCEMPEAVALVNPRRPGCPYPFTELAGVGVVYKLLCALEFALHPEKTRAECVGAVSSEYADLVAIGTVADVMPIRDENRLIVSYGLQLMETDLRPGLAELLDACRSGDQRPPEPGTEPRAPSDRPDTAQKPRARYQPRYQPPRRKITSSLIGYTIAPRINAAGRIAEASIAVELFLSESRERAREVANKLCEINRRRQIEENKTACEAYAKIEADPEYAGRSVIVLDDENWHHGIIGIVASRFTEKYDSPCILISFKGGGVNDPGNQNDGESDTETGEGAYEPSDEDIGKGSGRSIEGLNLVEALTACGDLLIKYGGHELAAGLTIKRKNLAEFRRRINEYAKERFDAGERVTTVSADCELTPADITLEQATELYALEPFGVSNPVPVFTAMEYTVRDVAAVGGGRHTKLLVAKEGMTVTAMFFCRSPDSLDLYPGDVVDLLCNLDINEFQNTRTVQFIVRDVRLCERQYNAELNEREAYHFIKEGLPEADSAAAVPDRDDFARVYNLLRRELRAEREIFSARALMHILNDGEAADINYIKLKFIIRIFEELNLLGVDYLADDVFKFRFIYVKTKTSLDKSGIYRKLRGIYLK